MPIGKTYLDLMCGRPRRRAADPNRFRTTLSGGLPGSGGAGRRSGLSEIRRLQLSHQPVKVKFVDGDCIRGEKSRMTVELNGTYGLVFKKGPLPERRPIFVRVTDVNQAGFDHDGKRIHFYGTLLTGLTDRINSSPSKSVASAPVVGAIRAQNPQMIEPPKEKTPVLAPGKMVDKKGRQITNPARHYRARVRVAMNKGSYFGAAAALLDAYRNYGQTENYGIKFIADLLKGLKKETIIKILTVLAVDLREKDVARKIVEQLDKHRSPSQGRKV